MSACDANWDVDLICKYFKESSDKVGKTGSWYNHMDPGGALNDRKHVFDLLLNHRSDTNPSGDPELGQSMIPWNQLNTGIVKAFKTHLACGSVVKLTFSKYMGWNIKAEPPSRRLDHPRWDGIKWLKASLTAGKPVRVYLKSKNHYVGFVGFSERFVRIPPLKFLVLDPWPGGAETGGATIKYAGKDTKFLGEAWADGNSIVYDSHQITAVQGFHPF